MNSLNSIELEGIFLKDFIYLLERVSKRERESMSRGKGTEREKQTPH